MEILEIVSEFTFQIPPFALPEVIPEVIPQQKLQLGNWVRWRQVPNGNFGCIIGVIYTHWVSCIASGLHYLVLLDENSSPATLPVAIVPLVNLCLLPILTQLEFL